MEPPQPPAGGAGGAGERPSVRYAAGEVRGRWVEAERGGAAFAAYLGVPYARPPIGHLRFKAPKRLDKLPGSGPLDAGRDPPPCAQINIHSAEKEVVGQEDCLYLNVYVPARTPPASEALLPVLFVVHGGAFEHGSGRLDAFGPHYLLNEDVVVVAANYRQGALGFLNLDTEEIPGNAGLKDLVMALRWVKANIAAFGGDPARVTALGWSTGASAVHILSLLPSTRDLFSRAALLSGHALLPRAYTERHIARATTLAAILGAADNSTEAVTRTLQEASVDSLLRACDDPRMRAVGLPLPSPERRDTKGAEPKLLLQDPESLLRQPKAPAMPLLLSVNSREGSFPFKIWDLAQRSPQALDELLPRLLPADLLPGADTAAALGLGAAGAAGARGPGGGAGPGPGPLGKDAALRLAQLVRDEYSGGGPIANNTDVFLELLGDTFLRASLWRALGLAANMSTEAAPLHVYQFQVDAEYNYAKKLYGISTPGATHTDDLGYLARFDAAPNLRQDTASRGVAAKTLRRLTKTLTDFVKGVPFPDDWPPLRAGSTDASSWPALLVGPGARWAGGHLDGAHQAFWESVYRDLRSRTSSIGRV
ncbi:juvenile hormone esterase-like isoform X2 [Thrips palmi]|uniref:Juvenile hormone esterase-like isoform X2 n=1 Tax=Thrips palmi TaxID=161013 RepID=A0A6P8YGB1_THRPL|nr:juvenile hormone esterase-like isoform X2 [Thrips palmi]